MNTTFVTNNNTSKMNTSENQYLSLSQFDAELQQQAQYAIQQEIIEPWENFENYLPQVTYNEINRISSSPTNNHPLSPINQQIKLDFTSPTPLSSLESPDSSILNQQNSPIYTTTTPNNNNNNNNNEQILFTPNTTTANTTPLETPLESPKNDLLNTPPVSFNLSFSSMNHTINPQHNNNSILQDNKNLTNKKSHTTTTTASPPQQKKSAHNAIERRYRNNINDRIAELKNAVPALLYAKVKDNSSRPLSGRKRSQQHDEDEEEDGEEYLDGVAVATKLNKATILRKATEYILHLKRQEEDMKQENTTLQHLLSQLPGGTEVLSRYQLQKLQHEQEIQRQRLQERNLQKQQQQQRKASKKSYRHTSPESTTSSHHSDCFNQTNPNFFMPIMQPIPQQSVTSRVFMAVFMVMSLFSSSPLSAGPSTKDQFESHNHISRTADNLLYQSNNSTSSFIHTFFSLSDTWTSIKTAVFIICLFQLVFPIFRSWFTFRKKATTTTTTTIESNNSMSLTPGDQKCLKIYTILVQSLKDNYYTQEKLHNRWKFYLALLKEMSRFVFRHWLGYEFSCYENQDSPQEQWAEACKWIKLNEVECLGGNPNITRTSMLYSCFHMLNLIEQLDQDEENEYVEQSRSRVYATAALQMALIIPHHGMAEKLSRYFWRLSMYQSGVEDDPLMRDLIFDCHQDDGEDRIEAMLSSRAWYETLQVMNHQIENFGLVEKKTGGGLSLSMTAPVLIPVGILSTLHLLDNLQTQFGRLIISVTAKPLTADMVKEEIESEFTETAFSYLMDMTAPDNDDATSFSDYHCLAHWLATVGAIVDSLWKSDINTANKLIKTIVKIPCSLIVSRGDDVLHKNRMNQLDELTKKAIIHILLGATFLKHDTDIQRLRGIDELWKAEKLKIEIKKLLNQTKNRSQKNKMLHDDLESSVLAFAEFVTAVTGLEAWITAWRLSPILAKSAKDCEIWTSTITEQIRNNSLYLRRMIRRHSLDGLRTNHTIVERLSHLCAFISTEIDEIDSACECNDNDDDNDVVDENPTVRKSEKALEILRGLY